MRFAFTDDQETLRVEARRFLSEHVDVRAPDPRLHAAIARLGWLDPDDDALGFVERCIVFEETGRALLPGAFLTTTVAADAIARCGDDEQRARHLPSLIDGTTTATYADVADVRVDDGRITGTASHVVGAQHAATIVVRCALGLHLVGRDAFTTEPIETADLTRSSARVHFDGPAEALASSDVAGLHTRAATLLASESIGTALAALNMAVAYATDRRQFDAPIGSFQAIKHKAADVARAIEAARLLTTRAALAIRDAEPSHAVTVSMAKAAANEAVMLAARENIQIHGGIGVTWEHDAHLYYRRALATQSMFGETAINRNRVALALLGDA